MSLREKVSFKKGFIVLLVFTLILVALNAVALVRMRRALIVARSYAAEGLTSSMLVETLYGNGKSLEAKKASIDHQKRIILYAAQEDIQNSILPTCVTWVKDFDKFAFSADERALVDEYVRKARESSDL